jgi:hypothetical protein
MAVLMGNRFCQFPTDYVLGASGTITPPASWTVALATLSVSGGSYTHTAVWSATVAANNLNELGSTTANGYARQTINKDQTANGWGASTTDTTGATTTGKQVTFGTFSSTGPSPNGANSWVITDGTTLNAGNFHFMGDTAATRTFNNGDTEKVTPSLKAA